MTTKNDTTLQIRVSKELRTVFEAAAASQDRSASQLIRDFMRDYAKKHAQGSLLK